MTKRATAARFDQVRVYQFLIHRYGNTAFPGIAGLAPLQFVEPGKIVVLGSGSFCRTWAHCYVWPTRADPDITDRLNY